MTAADYSPLAHLHPLIVNNRGSQFEAIVFAALYSYPYALRSFEFAPADGAIDCTVENVRPGRTFSERFLETRESIQLNPRSRVLLPFDVKSKISYKAENQIYLTSLAQRQNVAFYVGICAANPDFIEIIPNYYADVPIPAKAKPSDKRAVNVSRMSLLAPNTYEYLSPCNSPYRMPLVFLPEAFRRLRECARGRGHYINPWTHVAFAHWIPYTVSPPTVDDILAPDMKSQHYSAFMGTMEIWRAVRSQREAFGVPMEFDFVWMQPLLADFKLIVEDLSTKVCRQFFVQYKIDPIPRARASPMTRVGVSRNRANGERSWYFSDYDRFDYFFYQFTFSDGPGNEPTKDFYFLPEIVIPDDFYRSMAIDADFRLESFDPYRLKMDRDGNWVQKVYNIIVATPNPRKPGIRPSRHLDPTQTMQLRMEEDKEPDEQQHAESHIEKPQLRDLPWFCPKFFTAVMEQCASRLSGLLVVLSRDHPMGDFAFCRYRWTPEEVHAYYAYKKPPCTISTLPADTPAVPLHIFTKNKEGTFRGPSISAREFRRLNSCRNPRLLVFDMFSLEGRDIFGPLLVIPSEDMQPTAEQRTLYKENLQTDHSHEREERGYLIAEQLHTRCLTTDYTTSATGPMVFEPNNHWDEMWELLYKFTGVDTFLHPHCLGLNRYPGHYRVTVQELHQRLVEEHAVMEHVAESIVRIEEIRIQEQLVS